MNHKTFVLVIVIWIDLMLLIVLINIISCDKPTPAPDYRATFHDWPAFVAQAYGPPHIENTMQVWAVVDGDTVRTDSTLRFSERHVYPGYRVQGHASARCSGSWELIDAARLQISWFYPAQWCETYTLYSYPGWWCMESDKGRQMWFK